MGRRKRSNKTRTTLVAVRWCPVCFTKLDAVTSVEGEFTPKVGDCTICLGCASVLQFTEGMELRLSSLMEIPAHSRMSFAKLVQLIKTTGPGPSHRHSGNPFTTN
jgi:hypothetical protein